MSRIALFGGSFDPPHLGHMYNIQTVLNSGLVDEVWVVPADDDRYDKPTKASAQHRKKMMELALADFFPNDKRVSLNAIQLDKELIGAYTIDLLDELEKRYPKNSFWFVIGTENIEQLPNWKSAERLMGEKKFLAVPRPGNLGAKAAQKNITILDKESSGSADISSTTIRKMISENNGLSGLVCPQVAIYVSKYQLYRNPARSTSN